MDGFSGVMSVIGAFPNLDRFGEKLIKPVHEFGDFMFAQGFNAISAMDGDVFSHTAGSLLNLEPIPFLFSPDEWLGPVNPCSAQFDRAAFVLDGVGAAAKAIIGLNDHSAKSALLEVACSCNASKSATNDDYIPWLVHVSIPVDVMD